MNQVRLQYDIDRIAAVWADGDHGSFYLAWRTSIPLERASELCALAIEDVYSVFDSSEWGDLSGPSPMPGGPVVKVEILEEDAFPRAVELFAERLAAHGGDGELVTVRVDATRLDDVRYPVPGLTVGVSVRGTFEPTNVERLPFRGWRQDADAMQIIMQQALAWCDLPDCRQLVSVGSFRMAVDPGVRAWLTALGLRRGQHVRLTAEPPAGEVRRVTFGPAGHVSFSATIDEAGAAEMKEQAMAMVELLRRLAPAADYGLLTRVRSAGSGIWEELLNPGWVPEDERVYLRDCRDLERTRLPGVHAAQLVNPAALALVAESSEWRRLPTSGAAKILLNRDLASWLSPDGPASVDYQAARELFGPALISKQDIAAAAAVWR